MVYLGCFSPVCQPDTQNGGNMIKNIVFDMDGVLIDSEALILEIWKKIAQKE